MQGRPSTGGSIAVIRIEAFTPCPVIPWELLGHTLFYQCCPFHGKNLFSGSFASLVQ